MYAVVEIAGNQYKIEKGDEIKVEKLDSEIGKNITFDRVLLVKEDENNISVGKPLVKGATIKAKILDHSKDNTVLIFKKKKRKGYQKMQGHRQQFSKIKIEDIILK